MRMVPLATMTRTLESGSRPSTSRGLEAGVPSLGGEHIAHGGGFNLDRLRFIDDQHYRTMRTGRIRPNDILIVKDGATTGKTSFVDEKFPYVDAAVNEHVFRVEINESMAFSRYVFHFLISDWGQREILKDFRGATVGGIGRTFMETARIPLPPLPEQKRIAGILDQADALRRLRTRALEKLNTLGQAIFQEMFGESEGQGGNVALSSVADVASGITKGRKINGAATRSVPYMAVSNVQDQHLKLDTVKEIEATDEEIRRYALQKNDLLLTEGGDPDKLGRGTLWNDELPECIHQNHIFRVRITSEALRPEYLKWFVGSPAAKSYFFRAAKKTTGIASINKSQLGNLPVAIPSIERQREFERKLGILDDVRVFVVVACQKADSLFASLQHRAFRGEL